MYIIYVYIFIYNILYNNEHTMKGFNIISSSIYFIIYNSFNRYDNKILNNNINI